jgi:hypothetical protein
VSKREPHIILKTDERSTVLELEREGKAAAKSIGWGENRVFLRAKSSRSPSRTGHLVLTHLPAGPRPAAERSDSIFRTTETAKTVLQHSREVSGRDPVI